MNYITFAGDDDNINRLCQHTMATTIDKLISENLLTEEQGSHFYETHIVQLISRDSVFNRIIDKIEGKEFTGSIVLISSIE